MPSTEAFFWYFFVYMSLALTSCDSENQFTIAKLDSQNSSSNYIQFIDPEKLKPFKEALPQVDDPTLMAVLLSPTTMWYDHDTMVPVYQDSITPILGVRANSIGRELAVDGQLVFNTQKQFHFPFATAVGTDKTENTTILTFWAPPKAQDKVLPVAYWIDNTTRYRWIFPKETYFGEVLYLKSPAGRWLVYEIRTRKRYLEGWETQVYRPFPTSEDFVQAIKQYRPQWQEDSNLNSLIQQLQDPTTLQSYRLASTYYSKFFEPIDGYIDQLPAINDHQLVAELLEKTVFRSALGKVWKRNDSQESYAPTTQADFSIVPKNYEGGLFPVNEVSCNRCHQDTGRQFGEVSFNSLLYGEVWGEDRIFTWHLFEQNSQLYGAFHQNRKVNGKLLETKLLERYDNSVHTNDLYKQLPRRYRIIWQ